MLIVGSLLIVPGIREMGPLQGHLARSFDYGVYLVAFSIVLGILAEISYAVKSLKG
jgi:hypothetical protein